MTITIQNLIGEIRQTELHSEIESQEWYACPFCHYTVFVPNSCDNPGCTANLARSLASVQEQIAREEKQAQEQAERDKLAKIRNECYRNAFNK